MPRSFSSPGDRRPSSGMVSAAEILQFEHADLLISKQKLERARGVEVVRIKREQRTQDLCFSSRPFVLCGLPVRRLPGDQLLYERRNGRFILQITGHPEFGVPFGQDRLVPIFLATLAVQQKSQTIRFRTAAEMLESFGMHTGGKEYRRLVGAFERIFGATIFFGTDSFRGKATMIQRSRFNSMREAQIWYSREHPDQRTLSSEFENVIVLSDEFYHELIAHPVPNDLEAIKVLAASPAVLDLFMWLSYRCFTAKGMESIPLFGDFGLAGQIGTTDYSRPRRFRAMVEQWLGAIRALWPECPARLSRMGRRSRSNMRSRSFRRKVPKDWPCRRWDRSAMRGLPSRFSRLGLARTAVLGGTTMPLCSGTPLGSLTTSRLGFLSLPRRVMVAGAPDRVPISPFCRCVEITSVVDQFEVVGAAGE